MSCDDCQKDKVVKDKVLDEAVAVKKTAQMTQKYDILSKAVIALVIGNIIMALCLVWGVANAQRLANEAVLNALKTVAEFEVVSESTTTQTVEGDSAVINNADFEQYNDNATNGGGN